jgi:hypothetical protein
LPEDVTLTQYYHLRVKDVNAILEHWSHRQAAGMVPFAFRKVAKAKNIQESDADTDAGLGDEEEEGPNDGKDSESDDDSESSESDDGTKDLEDKEPQRGGGSNRSPELPRPAQSLVEAAENPSRVG